MKSLTKTAINNYVTKKEPFSLIFFVTNKCNARCKHCFIDFNDPKTFEDELTLVEIEKISKEVGDSLYNINLTGGEPFLRKDLFEIMLLFYCNAKVKSVFITTNGFFTEEIEDFITKFNFLGLDMNLTLSISIDDFEKEHDKNRGIEGLYVKAIYSYFMVEHNGVASNINLTITDNNYSRIVEIYNDLKKRGIKAITLTMMRDEGVAKISSKEKEGIHNAYFKLIKIIESDITNGKMDGYV